MFTRDTIHEYLEKYNLGSVRFTKLAGVGIGSLYKYMNGQSHGIVSESNMKKTRRNMLRSSKDC